MRSEKGSLRGRPITHHPRLERSALQFANMINGALRTILPIADWPEERARAVEITGAADPILPTPFRI